jgi:putative transposase
MHGHKIIDQKGLYYLTITTVGWIDVFTRRRYRDIILDSLDYCQKNKGLILNAYVVMSNHLHLIAQAREEARLSDILRDFKKYTSSQIIKSIKQEPESRRDWLLHVLAYYARYNKNNSHYQLWQRDNHPVYLYSPAFIVQKLGYLHLNPCRAGLVKEPEDYLYSNASNYISGEGLLDVTILELPGTLMGYVYTGE